MSPNITEEAVLPRERVEAGEASVEPPTLLSLAPLFYQPFPPERIGFLPKDPQEKGGKSTCKIFPIAEVWDYVRLLSTHAFGRWSTSDARVYVFEDRLVVFLKMSICGVSMWGVGEEMLKGTTTIIDENATTSAWAQAFKRACAYFGIGLYLYFLKRPPTVAYDPDARCLAVSPAELQRLVEDMYRDARRRGCLQLGYGARVEDLVSLQRQLAEPFPPALVDFLGHSVKSLPDGTKTCTAVPFVKVWHYVSRLNQLAYGQWSLEEEPVLTSTPLKVMVTLKLKILGHSMIGIGEEFWTETRRKDGKSISVPRENAVENAWAQAFKRCLQALGLGLDLRFLPGLDDVAYEYGRVSSPAALARDLYHRAGLLPATEDQVRSLKKLRDALGKTSLEDEVLSSRQAEELIAQLHAEAKARRGTPAFPSTTSVTSAASGAEPSLAPSTTGSDDSSTGITPKQRERIAGLCEALQQAEPDYSTLTVVDARELIATLQNTYRASLARKK